MIKPENRLGDIVVYETFWVMELRLHGGDIRRIESMIREGIDPSNSVPEYLIERMLRGLFTMDRVALSNSRMFYRKATKQVRVIIPRSAADAAKVHRQVQAGPGEHELCRGDSQSYGGPIESEYRLSEDDFEEWEEV